MLILTKWIARMTVVITVATILSVAAAIYHRQSYIDFTRPATRQSFQTMTRSQFPVMHEVLD